jgi:hypothetical protein
MDCIAFHRCPISYDLTFLTKVRRIETLEVTGRRNPHSQEALRVSQVMLAVKRKKESWTRAANMIAPANDQGRGPI